MKELRKSRPTNEAKNWPFRYLYSSFYFPSLKLKKTDPKTEIAFYESAEDLSQAGPAFALVDSSSKMSWVLAHEKELIWETAAAVDC